MPTYVFRCNGCGQKHERFLKIAERNNPTLDPCTECHKANSIERIQETVPPLLYQPEGQYRTSNNFNDRLKEIKQYRGNVPTTINTR